MPQEKKVAHFLNSVELHKSPPNDVIYKAYKQSGFGVTSYSDNPRGVEGVTAVTYGIRWLCRNMFKPHWRHYAAFSATSEDPIAIAGVLSFIWRKPLIFLSDEIKSGSYRGDRPNRWKLLCRWAMRRASLTIVNDHARVDLQRDYAGLTVEKKVIVYPGCFLNPPQAKDRKALRDKWGMKLDSVVVAFSGSCDLVTGIDWALDSLDDHKDVEMLAQPLALNPLNQYFLKNHRNIEQVYLERERLSWNDSWASMGGVDIGVSVYLNQAPQFQLMGISSNRLCMFLAMGVPVIVSRQPSFEFIEDYNCGVLVENAVQFSEAISLIKENLEEMKQNALKCAQDYIDTKGKYQQLAQEINGVLS